MQAGKTYTIPGDGDWPVPVHRWSGDTPPRAAAQIAHGMAEHAGRYGETAASLNRAGYAVFANDHRGHGPQARDAGTLGNFGTGGFPALVDDMVRLTAHIGEMLPGCPVVLLGHSMGSFAAQLYLLDHAERLQAAALSGTAALDLRPRPAPGEFKLSDYNAAFEPARTPYDWLSRDTAMVDAYVDDPLCGFDMAKEALLSMHTTCKRLAEPDALAAVPADLPLYLFTGDSDPVNGNTQWFVPLAERYRQAGLREVSYHVYGGARHETLNETNRGEVVAGLIAWLDHVTG